MPASRIGAREWSNGAGKEACDFMTSGFLEKARGFFCEVGQHDGGSGALNAR